MAEHSLGKTHDYRRRCNITRTVHATSVYMALSETDTVLLACKGRFWAAEVIVRGRRVPRLARLMILFLSCLNELYSYLSDLDDTSRSPVIYDFRASTCILRPHSWECTCKRTRLTHCASIRFLSSDSSPPFFFCSQFLLLISLSFFSPFRFSIHVEKFVFFFSLK